MSVKSPDIGEVCIGKYVNLSELFVRGLSLLLMKRFCMKTSRSMIFINKKAKPGRVNAEFNFTSRIFLCVDIIFLRQKQCFFKGDEFSEGWIFPSCCTVLSSAKKAVHKHHSIPATLQNYFLVCPSEMKYLRPRLLGSEQIWMGKNLHRSVFRSHWTRGTVQGFERHFDVIRRGQYFWPVWFRFYADSCKHLKQVRFCTVCAVKTWSLVTRLWLK